MNTFDLDLKELKSIESALHDKLGQVKDQISQITAKDTPGESMQISALRLNRSMSTSVLHDVQSRIKIEKTRLYEQQFVSIATERFPHSLVTSIPPEFKPEANPTNEIHMLEQSRVLVYQKLESAELSRCEFEEAIKALTSLTSPASLEDQKRIAALQFKKERAEKYFNRQSVKILRIRKRLFNLYARLPDRKIYTLTLARLSASEHYEVEAKANLKPVYRKRKHS